MDSLESYAEVEDALLATATSLKFTRVRRKKEDQQATETKTQSEEVEEEVDLEEVDLLCSLCARMPLLAELHYTIQHGVHMEDDQLNRAAHRQI